MGERSHYVTGTFCWADLGAPAPEAAATFYGSLLGWSAELTPGDYWIFTLGGKNVAGMFAAPDGFAPAWINYVSVEDADATVARARELGAEVMVEPRDLGGPDVRVGRSAILRDPDGAVLGLWQPGAHVGAGLVNDVGAMAWNNLITPDVERAASFYGDLLSWSSEPVDEGDRPYSIVRNSEASLNGGITVLPGEGVPPHWQVVFTVADAYAATAEVERLGGTVIQPAAPGPFGDFAVVRDPAGAVFALFAGDTDP